MVKCGVFLAVRTEFLNSFYTCFGFKGLSRVHTYITLLETLLQFFLTNVINMNVQTEIESPKQFSLFPTFNFGLDVHVCNTCKNTVDKNVS
jgi:hypothetical protein